MSNINVVTAMPELGGAQGDTSSPVTLKWKKEGRFGPFNITLSTQKFYGGYSDLEKLGVTNLDSWQNADYIIVKFEGAVSTGGTNKGIIKYGDADGISLTSTLAINTSATIKQSFVFAKSSLSLANSVWLYAPMAIGNKNTEFFPPTGWYYNNLAVSNGYLTIYTGRYTLN